MPRRELRDPEQVSAWLEAWGRVLPPAGALILIGSGGLLWHAFEQGVRVPLPENSMDVDLVTDDEHVARLAYDAMIGSEFEMEHGWHVNIMPDVVLRELPAGWDQRASHRTYGTLAVTVPSPADLLAPKLRRGEPRDHKHAEWAREIGIVSGDETSDA